MAGVLMILGWILKGIGVALLAVMVLLILPFHYSISASLDDDKNRIDLRLSWAWFLRLDRFIKKRLEPQPKPKRPETSASKSEPKPVAVSATAAPRDRSQASTESIGSTTIQDAAPAARALRSEDFAPAAQPRASKTEVVETSGVPETDEEAEGSLWQTLMAFWQQRHWLIGWAVRFLRSLHLTPLWVGGVCGLGDPYLTSELFRFVILLRSLLPESLRIDMVPEYSDSRLTLDVELSGWCSPLQILFLALRLFLDRTTWQLLRLVQG